MNFKLFGLNVHIDFLFVWMISVMLCFDALGELRSAILFSLAHECGHLAAIVIFGQRPKRICFGLFGMTIVRRGDLDQNYYREIITALAGPFVNIAFAILFFAVYKNNGSEKVFGMFAVNTLIAVFNLLPVFSLDGGRAFECFLKIHLDSRTAERTLKAVSFAVLLALDGFAVKVLADSGYNFTLLAVSVYLTVLLFVKC